jgi:hypothetical protein
MPKDHIKKHPKSVGADIIGSPDKFIKMLIEDTEQQDWAIDQLNNEGPAHKQMLNAILLKRLFKMVAVVESSTGSKFTLQNGIDITTEKKETLIPISMPLNIGTKINKEDIIKIIVQAPDHEILMKAITLQVIEWSIKAIDASK